MGATLEYAKSGVDGDGWYVVPHSGELPRKFFDRYFAEKWAKESGYELTEGSLPEPTLVLARIDKGRVRGPFPSRYRVRAFFAWIGYWMLEGMYTALHVVSCKVWQAEWRLGVVMFDRPCPRCGLSLWSGPEGCSCELTSPNFRCESEIPPEAEIQESFGRDGEVVRRRLIYHVRLRRDLFHWARGHEFFGKGAIESLLRDDNRYREMSSAEKSLLRLESVLGDNSSKRHERYRKKQ